FLLRKTVSLTKQQLSNTKAQLYRQVLVSLRMLDSKNIDIQLHEQLDHAHILYQKGLYLQSLKILDKIKETARAHNQVSILVQIVFLEKKIESLHITRSFDDRAAQLIAEAEQVNEIVLRMTGLSNLALQLYSWYIHHGHARNEHDEAEIENYFNSALTEDLKKAEGFYEKLYLTQSYCWYAFIRQDFLMYFRYAQHWADLFEEYPLMVELETASYIKGLHNLLTAHFNVRNYTRFEKDLLRFEALGESKVVTHNDHNRIQIFVYLYIARINQHILKGTFVEGISLVPIIVEKLEEYKLHLDSHRVLVFYYKIASLYFGAGDYGTSIDYLNKIIHWKVDLRNDLQCYSRLLHLIAHYELGHYELMEHLVKSVYRFMARMENLSLVEEEMFKFLRRSFHTPPQKLKPEFIKVLETIKQFEKNRFETRALVYLDIISWLESKVYDKPVYTILREKYLSKTRK
ncbi:MAG: hypothetical protein M3R25_15695, partial [Bacteroidota bacterium]|nr:hypothetical protein [Bacteroidota bacterium]